ncbi:MAG: hypothetical protein ACREKI_08960, partial [Gemmatimonadota bacterium]
MSHPTRETLSQILDESADPQAQTHLDVCELCRAELAAMGALREELRSLPEPALPDSVWSGVIRRLVAEG